jgi:thiol-disulfide isomerase/thioredoxin
VAVQRFFSMKWVLPILAVTFVVNVVWFGRRAAGPRRPAVGEAAPDFSLPLVDGSGNRQRLSDLSSGVVLVEFWAPWCEPCRQDVPALNAVHDLGDVTVVAVATPDSGGPEVIRDFVRRERIRYTVVEDDGRAVSAYGIETLPARFAVVDGRVRYVAEGGARRHDLLQQLRALVASKRREI